MTRKIETAEQLTNLLNGIEMKGTRFAEWHFSWRITDPGHDGWFIQCSFERPDANGGPLATGYGRKWWVDYDTSDTGVVFTAWLAIQQIIIHELHESFTVMVNGERVRLLDPHKELADLAVGSRRIGS